MGNEGQFAPAGVINKSIFIRALFCLAAIFAVSAQEAGAQGRADTGAKPAPQTPFDILSKLLGGKKQESGGKTTTLPDGSVVTEYPDKSRKTVFPDGKVVVEFPGGHKQTRYPDGKTVTELPDGGTKTVYPDGKTVEVFAGGLKQTEYPDGKRVTGFPDGSKQTKHPDGKHITEFPDGGTATVYPGGKKVKIFANGQTQTVFPDGKEETVFPDGARIIQHADGKTVQIFADGQKQTVFPDGREVTEFPGGQKQTAYPDGRKEAVFPDGGKMIEYPDGKRVVESAPRPAPAPAPDKPAAQPQGQGSAAAAKDGGAPDKAAAGKGEAAAMQANKAADKSVPGKAPAPAPRKPAHQVAPAPASDKAAAAKDGGAGDKAPAGKDKTAIMQADKAGNKDVPAKAPAPAPASKAAPTPGSVFRDCPVCPEMVVVPPGSFTMGSPDAEKDRSGNEGPAHQVNISYSFAAGVHEVTFAQWEACAADGGCNGYSPDDKGWGRGNRPAINVSWKDARSYLEWLSAKTGQSYRLLSESEWEYVARAGTTTPYHYGGEIFLNQARYNSNSTAPAGSYSPNAFGLHDVHGNVWEWTQDCWNDGYEGTPRDGNARESGDCSWRVLRGGSWNLQPGRLRSAARGRNLAGSRNIRSGIRVARMLGPSAPPGASAAATPASKAAPPPKAPASPKTAPSPKTAGNNLPSPVSGGSALLVVHTRPPGAEVLIGETPAGKTPLELMNARAGTYNLTLRHPHYETVHLPGQTLLDGQVERIMKVLARSTGSLTLVTQPRTVRIEWPDGKRLDLATPVTLPGLPAGPHKLKISAAEHRPAQAEVTIRKNEVSRLNLTLERMPHGTLTLDLTPPDSRVTLLDVVPRYRPGLRLPEGSHKVKVQRKGYRAVTREIKVAGDTRVKIALKFALPEMVVIPPGSFMMGSPPSEKVRYSNEGPVHQVNIAYSFAVGVHEVTFEEWDACVLDGGCSKLDDRGWGRGNRPVVDVWRKDVQSYLKWLSGKTGKPYRLLSESEWEYVARAGTSTARYWGESESGQCRHANGADMTAKKQNKGWTGVVSCEDGFVHTAPVGSYEANAFGLYDVLGNVWEWVQDCWNGNYQGAPNDGSAWQSGDCSSHVLRGGSWDNYPGGLRSAHRIRASDHDPANYKIRPIYGFRVARTLTP